MAFAAVGYLFGRDVSRKETAKAVQREKEATTKADQKEKEAQQKNQEAQVNDTKLKTYKAEVRGLIPSLTGGGGSPPPSGLESTRGAAVPPPTSSPAHSHALSRLEAISQDE